MLGKTDAAKLQADLHFMWLLHVVLGLLLKGALEQEAWGSFTGPLSRKF
jgi:hypothetical protein